MIIKDRGAIHQTGSKIKMATLIGIDNIAAVSNDNCCGDKCLVESIVRC